MKNGPLSSKYSLEVFDTFSNANGYHGYWLHCKFHFCMKCWKNQKDRKADLSENPKNNNNLLTLCFSSPNFQTLQSQLVTI